MVPTFKELNRASKAFEAGSFRLAIAGDCSTQFLATCVKGALARGGIAGEVFEAEYDQVPRQLLSKDSELRRFSPEIAVVWEAAEHWWETGVLVEDRLRAVSAYATAFPGKLLYVNAVSIRDGVFGSYPCAGRSFPAQVRAFNAGLDALTKEHDNLYVVDLNSIVAGLGWQQAHNAPSYILADMPLVPDAQAVLAQAIVDIVRTLQGKVKKCVIVDLDNTLWGGVIGEDGLNGIRISRHGVGKEFSNFQRYLKRLKDRGVLLAVCSKNDEEVAQEVFEAHPDMILRLDDFACFLANWNNKADNVGCIQRLLNIGMDSLVFIDDNPAEREIVRMAHPSVTVPEMPPDPSIWIDFLAQQNLFEAVSFSKGDAERTQQYRTEALRREFSASFKDEDSFLRGLEMTAAVGRLDDFTIPRAAQLTQRSNQFNLRTVRYSESDLHAYARDSAIVQLGFSLRDRFGAHGLVCVIIGKRSSPEDMAIDTWLMSCRVLKRGLEIFALNCLVREAARMGVKRLLGEYIPTRKNAMVRELYRDLGFVCVSENHYVLEISNYQEKECAIHEQESR